MAKKATNRLYLLVKDKNDIMADYVWATKDELAEYYQQGYVRLNK